MANQISGLKIDGKEYPWPSLDSLTMDEADTLYGYSKMTLDKLAEVDGFHPGMIMGLMHIAIARVRTDLKPHEITERVRAMQVQELDKAVVREEEEDEASPPVESQSESNDAAAPTGRTSITASELSPENGQGASTGFLRSAVGAG